MLNPKDPRLVQKNDNSKQIKKSDGTKQTDGAPKKPEKITSLNEVEIKRMEKERVGLFFEHNMQLGPPYHIIIDTNFINFSIQYKLDIF
jgi:U3 small nucleolar RNA-associated protein 24